MSFILKCSGCKAWQTAGHMSGVYFLLCDCGTVTTLPDFWEEDRALRQKIHKEQKEQARENRRFRRLYL